MSIRVECFDSVWNATEDSPEAVADMRRRSDLLISLTEHIRQQGWTYREASERLDVPLRRIKDLFKDRIWLFQQAELAELCHRAGCAVK